MTTNEKKYAEAYKKQKEKSGGTLSSKEWAKMSALRQELGLSFGQGDRITKMVDSFGVPTLHPMRVKGDIMLSNIKTEAGDPYAKLIEEIDNYSIYAEEIVAQTTSLLQKTDDLINEVGNYAKVAADMAIDNYKKGNKREAKVLGGAVAIVGIATWLYSKYKEAELNEKQERQLAELLTKKKELATLKLASVQQQCKRFRMGVLIKVVKLFVPELQKTIDCDEDARIRIKMFKLLFLTMVKSQYLVNTLEYVEAEMTAWLNGQQSSGMLKPLLAEAVDETIYSWFDDGVLSRNEIAGILKGAKNAHLASVFMLSEPYILRRHIGIKLTNSAGYEHDSIFASDHYGEPLILSVYDSISKLYKDGISHQTNKTPWTRLVTESCYYNKCNEEISSSFMDAPSEAVLPKSMKWKFIFIVSLISIFLYLFNPFYAIVGAICTYIKYREECKKLAEKLYPTQLHNYMIGAAQNALSEIDKFETNKL